MYLLSICLEKKTSFSFFLDFLFPSLMSLPFFSLHYSKKNIQMFFTLFLSFIFFSFILDLFVVSVCLPSFRFLLVYHFSLSFVPFWVDMSCLFVFMFLLCTHVFFNKVSNFSSFFELIPFFGLLFLNESFTLFRSLFFLCFCRCLQLL